MSQTSPVTATVTGSWSNDQELIALCMDMLGDVPGETLDQRVEKLVSYHLELQLMYSELRGHAQTPADEILWKAYEAFEFIRLKLINHLNEPERSAFWRAVQARNDVGNFIAAHVPTVSHSSTDCEGK